MPESAEEKAAREAQEAEVRAAEEKRQADADAAARAAQPPAQPDFSAIVATLATKTEIDEVKRTIADISRVSGPNQAPTLQAALKRLESLENTIATSNKERVLQEIYEKAPETFDAETGDPLFDYSGTPDQVRANAARIQRVGLQIAGGKLREFEKAHGALGGIRAPQMSSEELDAKEAELVMQLKKTGDSKVAGALWQFRRARSQRAA